MFGRNSFNFQRSLSTPIKLVHTLKKSLCGFWSNIFWKFIHKYNILSRLCLEETALTFKDLYQHTLNWFILKRSHFVDLKHEHWCFNFEGVYQTHDFDKMLYLWMNFQSCLMKIQNVTSLEYEPVFVCSLWWLFYCAVRQACFHSRDQPKWKGLVKVSFFFTFFPKLSDSQYLKPNWDLKNTVIHTVSCQNFCVFLFTYFLSELRRAIFNTIYFFFREIAMLSSKNFPFIYQFFLLLQDLLVF